MIFKRKIYAKLLEWKRRSKGSTAILIDGARRVGKSYVAETFGKSEYASCAIIDFGNPKHGIMNAIEEDPGNLERFFQSVEYDCDVTLIRRNSLIVFDEVQCCPKARQMIKHLVADGRYDYVETGSLVSINENVKDIVIPSEEEHLDMNPMDFEEFLWARGQASTIPFLKDAFEKRQPLGQGAHRTAMQRFREYLIVGGMPQAVEAYIDTGSFSEADIKKRTILELYRLGIRKHANGLGRKVQSIYANLPGALTKKEKKFLLSSLGKNSRSRDYEEAFLWLDDARIVNPCYNVTDPGIGLGLSADNSSVKLYSADTGLLITQSLMEEIVTGDDIYKELYFGNLGLNEGMFCENYVAQALRMSGRPLYFYSRYDNETAGNRMEIDFLVRRDGKISPIEVKSGKYAAHSSLDKFRKKFSSKLGQPIILYTKDVMEKAGILHLPLYMAMFL